MLASCKKKKKSVNIQQLFMTEEKKCEMFSPFWNGVFLEGLIVFEQSEKGHRTRRMLFAYHFCS